MSSEKIFKDNIKPQLTDEELVHFLQNGGPERYFSILADRYQDYVKKKCKGYVKSDDEAEDLSQEVFIKVFMQLSNFRSEAKFKTWLYTIVYHTCIDYLRKKKKSTHQVISDKLSSELEDVIEADEVDKESLMNALELLLEQITPEEKLLLLLKYKEKQSLQAITASMNISESAAKMRLLRAKEKINKLYEKQLKDN
ncbi:RNA polymerase sigma factor [Roseivirga spongicola]|jgi:RNA polymerase sigma-70 factor (ECF subfamily)|uniref:RNA polymerase sigma factor n=1 Tax=Roseivirga spongicola TaxID=333140 RepID=UPI000D7B4C13|nr:RNA polymerase sigma factor [Roseivirga spongicola]PWL29760.1 MAG: RNA polymerase subunit sigma-70 [Roseivirga sp. XM-24bin3]WPZ11542.1 RNA polymerase sigma factor [Roseivirga spongicola]